MSSGRSVARPLPRDPRPVRRVRSSVRSGLVWGVVAAACNIILIFVSGLLGVPFLVWPSPNGESVVLGPLSVIGATLFAALLAGLLAGLLAKQVRRAGQWILIAGVVVTIASLSAPLGQPTDIPASTKVVLTIVHLVTGALVTFGLVAGLRTDDRAAR